MKKLLILIFLILIALSYFGYERGLTLKDLIPLPDQISFNDALIGGGSGDFDKGMKAYESGDYKTAVREWKPLAEKGDANAQHKLGRMYRDGKGVSKDYKIAVKWFRLGANQGYAGAELSLGWMYDNGYGVPKDDKTAVKWYRLAAEQGNAGGQNNLGTKYAGGEGVPQNYETAIKWYRLAAAQGDDLAQYNLGNHYVHGDGVPQNYETAIKWYKLAAAQGYDKAIHNLKLAQSRQDSLKTQQEFIQIIKSAKRKFNQNSQNPAVQGKVLYDRTKEICALMTNLWIYDWVGKVAKVETNEDGWGVLEIELDTNLRLSTRDNVYGDYGSNTLINPGSDLFNSFMYLRKGNKIKFSGSFFKENREKGTCLNLMNGTLQYRVLEPKYEFKFTKIDKIN
jgi:TPR repeat protein